jgi:hypothetical protein
MAVAIAGLFTSNQANPAVAWHSIPAALASPCLALDMSVRHADGEPIK